MPEIRFGCRWIPVRFRSNRDIGGGSRYNADSYQRTTPHPADMFRSLSLLLIPLLLGPTLWANETVESEPEFAIDVMSVLSKAGCNAGTCHGNLNGKGGFKLSLRGDDPQFDYEALVLASRGRRVNFVTASQSLILQKATGTIPHRGGIRFRKDSYDYEVLHDWLDQGGSAPSPAAATVTRLDVSPQHAIVSSPQEDLQVVVTARFSDGTSRDVTERACYELSNLNGSVDASGRVTRQKFGETTLIARYLQQQVPVSIAFIDSRPNYRWNDAPPLNEIDRYVFAKLKMLRMNPAATCSDTVFVRRAYLDTIGRLPTANEAKRFAQSTVPGKRSQLVDRLISRPEFADFWALKWADILRTEEKVLDTKGVQLFHTWIRDNIASARPLDHFVRELILGLGNTFENPPANFYRANRDASVRGETTARLFLGTRLQCAKCHNHPFDHWTQDDYYGWAAFFAQIDYQFDREQHNKKLDKNEYIGQQMVFVDESRSLKHPTSGREVQPSLLGDSEAESSESKPRLQRVAQWLTSKDNKLFVQSQTNFIWYQLMGSGLVEPIDDFRLTNPASHPELLKSLASHFADSGFDIRYLVRMIMNSRTYQLSTQPGDEIAEASRTYAHAAIRRLPAEVILDMQSDVLQVPAGFAGYDPGTRAVQLPGVWTKQKGAGWPKSGDRFLRTFGKPQRILACDCERSNETTLKQAFVLLGAELNDRLGSAGNRLQRLAASTDSDAQVVEELYWTALSRSPSDQELDAAVAAIAASNGDRVAALQDITWALLNAKEFLFRR